MAIEPGTRLGTYEITAPLGAGGMGEVYAASDTNLRRTVAIKVLPEEFAADPERLARFEREAHLLASLTHANIAAIHGLEQEAGRRFLVLELVEGETLSERLSSGPLPIDEALQMGRQIAEALAAAHEKGIVHRDLKPANIKITPGGMVKVLDFGLAKALAPETDDGAGEGPRGKSMSPTITAMGTAVGVILGTAAYMSPEQARAKPVDKRTDIWAFGCVLFEAMTGRPIFRGETVTDILSTILQGEADWGALPERTPPRIRELLQRCLEKDLRSRLHDIGDARLEIERSLSAREWTESGFAVADADALRARRTGVAVWASIGVALVLGAAIGAAAMRVRPAADTPVTRLSIVPPEGLQYSSAILSPDGRTVAFRGRDRTADPPVDQLFTHGLDSFEDVPVPGSEGFTRSAFSPDGEWLAFVVPAAAGSDRLTLMKVPVDGSTPPVTVADWPRGMDPHFSWPEGGEIVGILNGSPRELRFFHTEGGTARAPVPLQVGEIGVNFFRLTHPLPGGRHLLAYADTYEERGWQMNVVVVDTQTGQARIVVPQGSIASYSPTGHLVFTRQDTLLAVGFDLERLETKGAPVALTQGIRAPDLITGGWFDVSPSGTLLYMPGVMVGSQRQLAIVDREGKATLWSDERHEFTFNPTVTRDGRQLAVAIADLAEGVYEIWSSSVDRPQLRPIVDRPAIDCAWPVWMPDGRRLLFSCFGHNDPGGLYVMDIQSPGEAEQLVSPKVGNFAVPTSVSSDGRWAIIMMGEGSAFDVMALSLENPGAEMTTLLPATEGVEAAYLSPDDRWVSFSSAETGRREMYIAPFREGKLGPKRTVSLGGGEGGIWIPHSDGRSTLTYFADGRVFGVEVTSDPALSISEPVELFDAQALRTDFMAAFPDGRFLIVQRGEDEDATPPIHLVINWTRELKARLP